MIGPMRPAEPSSLRRLRDDAGFLMIEILVSASILLIVATGALSALDTNDRLAANQQKRAIAANLAQAEIERVRSLPIEDVAALKGSRDVTESGTTYTVSSTTRWVTDGTDGPDCSTRSGGLDYMRLSTTVGWKKMDQAKPIKLSTIVTPSSRSGSSEKGSLSVQLSRATPGDGASGIVVVLSGPETLRETTNDSGCVIFPYAVAGPYVLSFSKPGWVDGDNVTSISRNVSVVGGTTTKLEFKYDEGGTTQVSEFYARREQALASQALPLPLAPAVNDESSYPESLVLFNSVQTKGPFLVPLPGGAKSWDARPKGQLLFPSKTPYAVYAGQCSDNAPQSGVQNVFVPAGGHQSAGRVQLPSLNLVVYTKRAVDGSILLRNDFAGGAKISYSDGCGGVYHRETEVSGGLMGRLKDPGFPYSGGKATLCIEYNGRRFLQENVTNTDMTNSPQRTPIYMGQPTGGTTATTGSYAPGSCGF